MYSVHVVHFLGLYRQIVGIPIGTPLVADFLYYYKREFVTSLSVDNQPDTIEEFKSTSRYLDDQSLFRRNGQPKCICLSCN